MKHQMSRHSGMPFDYLHLDQNLKSSPVISKSQLKTEFIN